MDPLLLHPTTDFIKHWATEQPDRTACCDMGLTKAWTYAELEGDVSAAAAHLVDQGVQAGDRVAVLARNSVYLVILQHALMRLGAIFVPLNWRLSPPELGRLIADCSPAILYTRRAHPDGSSTALSTTTSSTTNPSAATETAAPPPDGCRHLDLQVFIDALQDARESPPPPPITLRDLSDDAVATILYTSGTSGKPKGVVMTRSTMSCTAANFSGLGNLGRSSRLLCDAPMFHVIGLVVAVWAPLSSCAVFVVSPRFDPAETNDRLAASSSDGITHYFCVPQMADALSAAPNFNPEAWTSLEALFTGGAPNPASRINSWLARGVLMVDGYGTTETGTALGMPLSAETVAAKAGSVGRSPTCTEVEIMGEDGNPVAGANVAGEIAIAGPSVSPGYWGGLSAADGRPVLLSLDGSGMPVHVNGAGNPRPPWFRTGDVGYRDEDGFVYVMGRRKDVFISGGENVYPVEVEAALMEHPEVAEAAVVGVPDARWGEVGRAYIVLLSQSQSQEGRSDEEEPTSDKDLVEHCRGLIGAYKIPKQFRFLDSLPRTGSGKVMKHVLRAEAAAETDATQ